MNTHEIIDLIVKTYSAPGSRSVTPEGFCLYNGPDGKHCAFALMCSDPESLPERRLAITIIKESGDKILKPEFRGHSESFYAQCQHLHDSAHDWDMVNGGLTEDGENRVRWMKQNFPIS